MPETLNLNYYYGNEADQYSFYRIPKILLTDRRYKGVCSRTRFLRISDNENENFIGKSRKEFLAPLTRMDDP